MMCQSVIPYSADVVCPGPLSYSALLVMSKTFVFLRQRPLTASVFPVSLVMPCVIVWLVNRF